MRHIQLTFPIARTKVKPKRWKQWAASLMHLISENSGFFQN